MKKKLLRLSLVLVALFSLSGCFGIKNEKTLSTTYVSVYPVEYLLDSLYGKEMAVYSIYPDGTNYNDYKLSNKQINDYSTAELFIYNSSISKEKDYTVSMLNKNKNLKIIDASLGMTVNYNTSELWLNPSNYLMMASNIKNGLEEYVNTKIDISDKIDKNYEDLKLEISSLDADLKETAKNAVNPTIVTSNTTFKFLEKYGFKVYTLDKENLTNNDLENVRKQMRNKSVSYIFMIDDEKETDTIKKLKEEYNVQILRLNSLSTLSADNRKNKKDYVSIMNDNINSIKLEINN